MYAGKRVYLIVALTIPVLTTYSSSLPCRPFLFIPPEEEEEEVEKEELAEQEEAREEAGGRENGEGEGITLSGYWRWPETNKTKEEGRQANFSPRR